MHFMPILSNRKTLYDYLEDNAVVNTYPDVRGMGKNLFFFHHTHAEGGADEESMSKYNTFEVTLLPGRNERNAEFH
jgi:hypothetical protein